MSSERDESVTSAAVSANAAIGSLFVATIALLVSTVGTLKSCSVETESETMRAFSAYRDLVAQMKELVEADAKLQSVIDSTDWAGCDETRVLLWNPDPFGSMRLSMKPAIAIEQTEPELERSFQWYFTYMASYEKDSKSKSARESWENADASYMQIERAGMHHLALRITELRTQLETVRDSCPPV